MPTTEELGSENYEKERCAAVRGITNRIIEISTGYADEDLTAEQLAELVSEIEDYSSRTRKEGIATAYDKVTSRREVFATRRELENRSNPF